MSAARVALVVEDSEDQVELLRHHLTKEGFDVVAVASAEAAFAAFDEIDPTVAVIDLLLPGIGGEECARRVRERFPDCLIVISSVLDAVDYPIADAVLPKPVRGARLHEILAGLAG
jgi:DNA-binding response OmpR family regulator